MKDPGMVGQRFNDPGKMGKSNNDPSTGTEMNHMDPGGGRTFKDPGGTRG